MAKAHLWLTVPQAVVAVIAGAIGDWQVLQPQRIGGQNRYSRIGITAPRQDIENDVGGMDAVGQGFGAGHLDSRQAVGQYCR